MDKKYLVSNYMYVVLWEIWKFLVVVNYIIDRDFFII